MSTPVRQPLLERLRRDLRTGIAVVVPIVATVWVLGWLFRFLDAVLGRAFQPYLPMRLPGLGVLLLAIVILAVGALSRSRLGVRVILWLDRRLSRIPLASWVYGTATQITQSTIDSRSGTFKRCVLVQYPKENSWALGFVTAPAPEVLRARLGVDDLVAVFVPTTPNPTSGFMLLVPESETVETGVPTETGFRLVISAGAVRIDTGSSAEARRSLAEFLSRI